MKYEQLKTLHNSLTNNDVTFIQLFTLATIKENPGVKAGDLAKLLGCTSANISGFLTRSMAQNLVTLTHSAEDRRAVAINITGQGENVLNTLLQVVEVQQENKVVQVETAPTPVKQEKKTKSKKSSTQVLAEAA